MILKRRFVWAKDDRSGDTGWIPAWIPKSAEFSPSGARGMMHDIFEHKLNDTGTFANELEAFGRIVALRPVVRADVFGVELYDLWGDADYYDFEAPRVRCDSVDFWALKSIRSITKNFGRTLREHDMERAEIATTCTKAFNLMCLGWMDAQRRYAGNCSHIGSFAMDFGERARLPEGDYDGQVLTVVVDTVAWSWSFRVSADLDAYGRAPAWARAVYRSWLTR